MNLHEFSAIASDINLHFCYSDSSTKKKRMLGAFSGSIPVVRIMESSGVMNDGV